MGGGPCSGSLTRRLRRRSSAVSAATWQRGNLRNSVRERTGAKLRQLKGLGGMRCPYCAGQDTQVKDSRPTEDNTAIRRRRVCSDCGGRFTTFERVQLRELMVLKRSGRRVPFDREKLSRSIGLALRKRPVEPDRIERLVSGLVRQLESGGESDIPSDTIGAYVMDALRSIDSVGYVRFASVYKDFTQAADFETVLSEIAKAGERRNAAAQASLQSQGATQSEDVSQGEGASDVGSVSTEPPAGEPAGLAPTKKRAKRSTVTSS